MTVVLLIVPDAFGDEVSFRGLESSQAFVQEPQRNDVVARFLTLKEHLL